MSWVVEVDDDLNKMSDASTEMELLKKKSIYRNGDESINEMIHKFCNPDSRDIPPPTGTCLHVLDMFRKSLLMKPSVTISMTGIGMDTGTVTRIGTATATGTGTGTGTGSKTGTGIGTGTGRGASKQDRSTGLRKGQHHDELIPTTRSATELNEAGVRFKGIKKSPSIKDISFEGVLSLPTFVIDDTTKSTCLNMIAFEHCHVGADHEDLTIDPASKLGSVNLAMSRYCERRRNRWRANLIHTYFTNPWTLISVVAAGVLFGLTIAQTA
ncbi:unnamed protein product [Ilex paraguariensis]|uniref:Uncharacterized protein n=1 Tax=Ilex paraguariensis TaxID=185542 RepID=A0ABC8SYX8_9AQUA